MDLWFIALLALIGVGLALLLFRWHYALSLVIAALLFIYSIGGGAIIEKLSPEAFAKLPISGWVLGNSATWCLFVALGFLAGLIVRAGLWIFFRKGKQAARSTGTAPE